jgi:maltooligosyltrehalose trehalohydrolase
MRLLMRRSRVPIFSVSYRLRSYLRRSRAPEYYIIMGTAWRPTLGAIVGPAGTEFRVWAPRPHQVDLVLHLPAGDRVIPTSQEGEYRVVQVGDAGPGTRYRYRLDGDGPFPDPCSRSQPEGVHGPSEVVDPSHFRWTDDGWTPPAPADLVIYECHIGTFTPPGTFDAAIGQLPRLRDLGVNTIELLPVSSWPGRWNWGYDGVTLFAPPAPYGGPAGLRRFVDAAHRAGLAVLLDVVYNHFGPDGNYTGLYATHYLTRKHHTPWGDAVNYDGTGSLEVRRFVLENLSHWVHEYHVDGFRFDATFAIIDSSPRHILADVADTLTARRRTAARPILIAETHENDPRYMRQTDAGGFGFDAVWADDFHHIVRTLQQPERQGYLANYAGTAEELAAVVSQGFFFEGQRDRAIGERRGQPARAVPWPSFVYCIQNHDQVGNRAFGQRLNVTALHADFLAASLLLLLLPQTPLLFQGQEFLASTPFLFFTDHNPELGRLVTAGRRQEFASFAAFSDPAVRELIPDPQDPRTFFRSNLNLDEAAYGPGLLAQNLYRAALHHRATDPALVAARRARAPIAARAQDKAVLIELATDAGRRLIAANFGGETAFANTGADLAVLLHTGDPRFGGNAVAPRLVADRLVVPPHSAALLEPQ